MSLPHAAPGRRFCLNRTERVLVLFCVRLFAQELSQKFAEVRASPWLFGGVIALGHRIDEEMKHAVSSLRPVSGSTICRSTSTLCTRGRSLPASRATSSVSWSIKTSRVAIEKVVLRSLGTCFSIDGSFLPADRLVTGTSYQLFSLLLGKNSEQVGCLASSGHYAVLT
jgi:hypothetical protein